MRTLDEQNRGSYSLPARLARDARLLFRLFAMVFGYSTRGALVRWRYRRKERAGEIYWLDED